jgi:hypothetical protein
VDRVIDSVLEDKEGEAPLTVRSKREGDAEAQVYVEVEAKPEDEDESGNRV